MLIKCFLVNYDFLKTKRKLTKSTVRKVRQETRQSAQSGYGAAEKKKGAMDESNLIRVRNGYSTLPLTARSPAKKKMTKIFESRARKWFGKNIS